MKRALTLLLLPIATAAFSQEAAPVAGEEEIAVIERALEASAAGDLAGAIALVEGLGEGTGAATRALLGALYVEEGRHGEALATLEPLTADEDADAVNTVGDAVTLIEAKLA